MSAPNAPSVTLTEVLHLALPAGAEVLAGEQILSRRVNWARLLRARPAGLSGIDPNELLILPPGLLESLGEPRIQARVVGELIEAGVAALVIAGAAPEGVQELCEQQSTPLLGIPARGALADVERAIIGLILDRDSQLRRRAEEIYGRLLETMLGNAGLPALLSALADSTGLRVAVFDDYLGLQACAPSEEPFRSELAAAAHAIFLRESSAGLSRLGRPLSVRLEHERQGWIGQLHPLQIGSAWSGYLGLLGRPGEVGDLDRLLADRAATLVALELAKDRAVAEATQRWRGEFLDDLLEGNFPTDEAVVARGQQLGYDLVTSHLTFVLAIDPVEASVNVVEAPLSAARQRRRFGEVGRAVLTRLEPRSLAVERDGALVVLVPAANGNDTEAAVVLVEEIRRQILEALPGLSLSSGIGRPVSQPRQFPVGQREAIQALEIGQKLLGGGRTLHYGQLGVERLLFHLLDHPSLAEFALDLLGDLLSYDSQHRGELVRTLEVFLSCNGNHVRAAQELHLHRNTLLYRLERAREILGRDLEDAETRLALQVALRIRGTISETPSDQGRSARRVMPRRRRAG